MQTVGKLIGRTQLGAEPPAAELISNGRLGVEIELEGFGDAEFRATNGIKLWTVKEDGSLRNGGVEFVTNGGLGGKTLVAAFDEVDALFKSIEFNASWRCSTHMHVNMLDMTPEQVVKFILAYIALEPVFFDHCEASRKSSNFCVLLYQSMGVTRQMVSSIRENAPLNHIRGIKYMALNALPLGSLGTLEFRGSHALTSKEELLGLANRLLCIREFVLNFDGTMDDMVTLIQNEGFRAVIKSGVTEGYVPDPEEMERASMAAWACLKYYQRDTEQWNNLAQQREAAVASLERTTRAIPQGTTFRNWFDEGPQVATTGTARPVDPFTAAFTEIEAVARAIAREAFTQGYLNNPDIYINTSERITNLFRRNRLISDRLTQILGGSRNITPVIKSLCYNFMPQMGSMRDNQDWAAMVVSAMYSICNQSVNNNDDIRNFGSSVLIRILRGRQILPSGQPGGDMVPANRGSWSFDNPFAVARVLGYLAPERQAISYYGLTSRFDTFNVRLRRRAVLASLTANRSQPGISIGVFQAWKMFQCLGVPYQQFIHADDQALYVRHARIFARQYHFERAFPDSLNNSYTVSVPGYQEFAPSVSRQAYAALKATNQDSLTTFTEDGIEFSYF